MYSALSSFCHACRSSSLTSLLAGDHGNLTASRSLPALTVTYGLLKSSGDNSKSFFLHSKEKDFIPCRGTVWKLMVEFHYYAFPGECHCFICLEFPFIHAF